MVCSLVTIIPVFKPLLISKCSRRFRRMKEINFIFGKGVFNAVGREASGPFLLVIDLKCSIARIPKFLPV